ncbi:hypothetical protein [Pelagibius sp.]|uniref:HD domain-containing protein n=1 Tax=Pelagibius sp. TaxID=1931238 RepID=UPI003B50D1E7
MSGLLPTALLADLRQRYGEPQRHYHTWAHIEALLSLFAEVRAQLCDPAAVEAALYYHDAVYDPRASDNEARSAALLRQACAGVLPPRSLEAAAQLVEATAAHRLPEGLIEEGMTGGRLEDARLFLDMDLSILAAGQAEFEAYEAAIRREYGHVDAAVFGAGRRRILEGFLARERLYFSDHFAARFEAPARANLARSLALLA